MRYDYGFILKRQCLIEALIKTTGCNQIHGQKGSEKPWLAKNKGTTGRWCWRAHGGSCARHSFPFLMRYEYVSSKGNAWLKLWFKLQAATKSLTNKGSEKPWLAKWGDYRQAVLKSSWRKLCLIFMSISNEVWLWFSPQKAMFDWSSDSDYRQQLNPWPTRVQRSPDRPKIRGLQAGGVEELMEEVVPFIHVHF